MATVSNLIDRVLRNCGAGDAGDDREAVLEWLQEILTVDIPDRCGGIYAHGYAELTLGGTGYQTSGIYDWPDTLRSFEGAMVIDSDVITDQQLYSLPHNFEWATKNLTATFSTGSAHILAYGRKFHIKPAPPESPTYTLKAYGTVYRDVSAYDENTDLDTEGIGELVPALVAGTTVLCASAREKTDVVAVWSPIWQRRLSGLADASNMSWRRTIAGRAY